MVKAWSWIVIGIGWACCDPAGAAERLRVQGRRLWVSAADVLVVTDAARDRVALFDVSGEVPRRLGEFGERGGAPGQLTGPHGALLAGESELVVADTLNQRVQSFDAREALAGRLPPLRRVFGATGGYAHGLGAPMALAASDDALYVADPRARRVWVFDHAGRPKRVIGPAGTAGDDLGWPSALVSTAEHVLWVADTWAGRVLAFDGRTGRRLGAFGADDGSRHLTAPVGLARSPSGELLVSDAARDDLTRWLPASDGSGARWAGRLALAGRPSALRPGALAVDRRGRLYVCDREEGACARFTAEGRFERLLAEDWQPPEWAPAAAPGRPLAEHRELRGCSGSWEVRLELEPWPPEPRQPFGLRARVRAGCGDGETAGGEPAELRLSASMPEHRHGMSTQPRVTRSAPGVFTASGLLFHMPGLWQLHLDLLADGVLERVQWAFEVE